MLEALSGGGVAAVGDNHPAAGIAVLLEFQHDAFQCAVLPPRFADNVQLSRRAGLTNDPDAQHPRHSGDGGLHPAIAGQIRQRFQREEQMRVLVVAEHLRTDGVEVLPSRQLVPQVLGQKLLLRAGGQAVQHEDPLAGVLLLVFFRRQLGRIVAAGQGTRDGDGIPLVGSLESLQPVADVRAGGGGLSFVSAQGRCHAHSVQRAVVAVLLMVGDDLQRDTGEVHALQRIQVCGGVHNDLGLHKRSLPFSGRMRRHVFMVVGDMISVFQKPVNCFCKFFQKISHTC